MVEGNRVVASTLEATTGNELAIDRSFLSRLFLGALADHEQRRLVARLLLRDTGPRWSVAAAFGPFALPHAGLASAYDASPGGEALRRSTGDAA